MLIYYIKLICFIIVLKYYYSYLLYKYELNQYIVYIKPTCPMDTKTIICAIDAVVYAQTLIFEC